MIEWTNVIYDTVYKLRAKHIPPLHMKETLVESQGTMKPSGRSVIDFATIPCLVLLHETTEVFLGGLSLTRYMAFEKGYWVN